MPKPRKVMKMNQVKINNLLIYQLDDIDMPEYHMQAEAEPAQTDPVDEAVLSMSDSFILEQLRGWRLLTSASLNQEEWRDVLGACQGKLDYASISEALQVLYDEQMIGSSRGRHGHPGQPQIFSLEDDWGGEEWGDHYENDWDFAYYQGWYDDWEEPWWHDQLLHDGGAGDEARGSTEEGSVQLNKISKTKWP